MWGKRPRNDRDWSLDQTVLPHITFVDDDHVHIEHVRDITYRSDTDFDLNYYDRTYDLGALSAVDLVIAPFWGYNAAHTFLIFHFSDGRSLAISIEIRKPRGERFNLRAFVPGHFELMYVIADPDDVVKLRTDIWKFDVHAYPLKLEQETMRALFKDMLSYAQFLETNPQFYHPFHQSCAQNLVWHLRRAGIPLPEIDWRYVLPEHLDEIFRKRGLIANG